MFTGWCKQNVLALVLSILALSQWVSVVKTENIDDNCNGRNGTCKRLSDCPDYAVDFSSVDLNTIIWCDPLNSILCCPKPQLSVIPRFGASIPETISDQECIEFSKIAPKNCPTPFITGGTAAVPKEFPSAVLLGERSDTGVNWRCGGTLISKRFVLTAAHCTRYPITVARLGELDYSTETDYTEMQEINVTKIPLVPSHFEDIKYNDIALVELDRDAIFTDFVFPACLPPKNADYQGFTAVGWGETEKRVKSTKLLKVHLERFTDSECKKYAEDEFNLLEGLQSRIQICAGSRTTNADTCFGDSGGPLYVSHPDYQCMHIVAAITAIGPLECGTANSPSINTKVNYYRDWIETYVWNASLSLSLGK